jgi:hypothetical protein
MPSDIFEDALQDVLDTQGGKMSSVDGGEL